jgi:hypothetical protein
MNNQAGIQDNRNNPARIPPASKLIQARQASMRATELLQIISNVFITIMYSKTVRDKMGIYP